jgi:hypothetical protein
MSCTPGDVLAIPRIVIVESRDVNLRLCGKKGGQAAVQQEKNAAERPDV